jgi:hypothetical protein
MIRRLENRRADTAHELSLIRRYGKGLDRFPIRIRDRPERDHCVVVSTRPATVIGQWLTHHASAREAYSTLLNGQSDASQSPTARQRGTSSAAWLARTQDCAWAS